MEVLLPAEGLVTSAELQAAMYLEGGEPAAANDVLRVRLTQLRRTLQSAGVQ